MFIMIIENYSIFFKSEINLGSSCLSDTANWCLRPVQYLWHGRSVTSEVIGTNATESPFIYDPNESSLCQTAFMIAALIPGIIFGAILRTFHLLTLDSVTYEDLLIRIDKAYSSLVIESPKKATFPEQGIARIKDKKTGCDLQITIKTTYSYYGQVIFEAMKDSNSLGYLQTEWVRTSNEGNLFSEVRRCIPSFSSLSDYGDEACLGEAPPSKIYVAYMKTVSAKQCYRGIGSALMQAAMEYSYFRGCEGRILLDAAWSSHGFYYKLGMRTSSCDPDIDKAIEERIESGATDDFGSHYMYLQRAAREEWKTKILKEPIFQETKEFLTH